MTSRGTELSASEARVGTWLRDKYRLDRVLGEGGMAVVYAATHRNKKRFAVKMLHLEFSSHPDIHARFLREGYVANTVDHPGAVAVLDDDIAEDGSAFLVMELLEGVTVEELAARHGGRLEAPVVLAIAHQLLDVLAAAHAQDVVHRDIKPANLFVARGGVIKVLDFGIARLREAGGSSSATKTGLHLGTPAFMSPEQASGRTSLVDARSDLWSVGATLFFLMTGRDVHIGETPQHMVMLAATTPAAPIASILPGLPARVAAIVDRALALDKGQRWPNAAAMRDAVGAAYAELVGEPVSSHLLREVARAGAAGGAPGSGSGAGAGSVRDPAPALATDPTVNSSTFASAPQLAVAVGRTPAVNATMDPVSSSPSRTLRRTRQRVVAALAGVGLLAAATVAGVTMRARPALPAHAASPAPPPPPVETSQPRPPPPPIPAPDRPSPSRPQTSQTSEASEALDASPVASAVPARASPRQPSPQKVSGATSTRGAHPPSGASDFDRQ